MGGAAVHRDHEFLSRSPSLGRERGLGVLLKERRLALTEGTWFEQHQVCLGGREILLAGIRGLAPCQQYAKDGDEGAECGRKRSVSKCGHHVGEKQNTERGRGFTRPETTTPAFVPANAGGSEPSCDRSIARRVPTLAIQHRVFAGIPEEIRHAAGDGVHWPVEAVVERLPHWMQEKSQPAPRIVI